MTVRSLGPFVAGERPPAWEHQFTDQDGAPLDLTGYTFRVVVHEPDGTRHERLAVAGVAPRPVAQGWGRYVLTGDDVDTAGEFVLTMWAGNGMNRYASDAHTMRVKPAAGAAPNI